MQDEKPEKIAIFRYGLIAPLVLETLPRGELTRRQVSVDTLLDWALRYRRNGLDALAPKPRHDRGQLRAITPETAALIEPKRGGWERRRSAGGPISLCRATAPHFAQ